MAGGTRDRWNLFLCSFTILFVELVCIRWIPAYIRYLGYFTNFVLLGSFLGIVLGQNLGRLLAAVRPPLTAYTLDVAGAIAGSLLFALVSFLGAPPGVWFALAALGVLALPQRGGVVRALNAAILLGVVVGVSVL